MIRGDVIGATVPLAQYAHTVAQARPRLVESPEQYAFIYAVLSEWVRSGGGGTTIHRSQLSGAVLHELPLPPRSGYGIAGATTRFQAEFLVRLHFPPPLLRVLSPEAKMWKETGLH